MGEKRANVRGKVEQGSQMQEKRGEKENGGEKKENRERVTGRTQGKNKKKMRNRISRETREGWTLLNVETKGTQRVQMEGALPW